MKQVCDWSIESMMRRVSNQPLVCGCLVEVTRIQTGTGPPEEKLELFEDLYSGLKVLKHNINLGLLIVTAFTWTKYFPTSD